MASIIASTSIMLAQLVLIAEQCIPDATTPEAVFGNRYNHVAMAGDGHLFLARDLGQSVLHFDAHGRFVGALGRRGQGPGEFRSPFDIRYLHDSLWVFDNGLRRVSVFTREGAFVRLAADSRALDRISRRFWPTGVLSDGRLIGSVSFWRGRTGGAGFVPVMAVAIDNGEAITEADTITLVYEEDPRFPIELTPSRIITAASWVNKSSLWAPDIWRDGIIVVDQPPAPGTRGGAYTLRRVSPNGHESLRQEIRFQPISLKGGHGDWIYESYAALIAEDLDIPVGAVTRALRRDMPLPETHPPVTKIVSGADGSIWLQRELPQRDSVRWDIFTPSGELAGSTWVPSRIEIAVAGLSTVWAIQRDTLGVPSLCRYAVRNSR